MASELKVSGMDCTNCALGISRSLDKSGFTHVIVDFASGRVSFDEEDAIKVAKAIKTIQSLGYQVIDGEPKKTSFLGKLENRLILSTVFTLPLLAHMFLPWHFLHSPWVQLCLASPVYMLGLAFFGRSAWGSLKAGVANMDVLVILGASAAFFYSLTGTIMGLGPDYQFYESAASIITIIMFGNLIEHRSVKNTGAVVDELEKLQGETAKRLEKSSDHFVEVKVSELQKGDWVLVNQGEAIPADGLVLFGRGASDESLVSGESMPLDKAPGDTVIAGSILIQGSIRMEVRARGNETILSGIVNLVRKAQMDKPKLQNLADRISAVFVPAVVGIALATFLLSYFAFDIDLRGAILRCIAVLVVACPCALGLAIPTAVVVGIGLAAKKGILIKKAGLFDSLARARHIVFDKTGTLSSGQFSVSDFRTFGIEEHDALRIIYNLEKHSNHPIAKGLLDYTGRRAPMPLVNLEEIAGQGIRAQSATGDAYSLGKDESMDNTLELRVNGDVVAVIKIGDTLKADAKESVQALKELGMKVYMLSGDKEAKAREMASELGILEVYANQKPEQKLAFIDKLNREHTSIMVGDGINDAPALGKAGVGISFGTASGIAINTAQIVLLDKQLRSIPTLLKLSRLTQVTIRQNLFWAFFYNILMIPLAAFGLLDPMIAALAMALSDVIVVFNSLRLRWIFRRSEARIQHIA